MAFRQKIWTLFDEGFIKFFLMNDKDKVKIILKTLNKIYPKTPIPLKHKNTFTLLTSVLLSAQCTDLNVNKVTKYIYPKYYKPEHFVIFQVLQIFLAPYLYVFLEVV